MIAIHPKDVSKTARIGALLQNEKKAQFENFLKNNVDVFVWSHNEMLGIKSKVMVHRLNVDPYFKPIQQKRCIFTLESMKQYGLKLRCSSRSILLKR